MFFGVEGIPWSIVGYSLAGGALTAVVLQRRKHKAPDATVAATTPVALAKPLPSQTTRWPEPTLPILDFDALVAATNVSEYLEQARKGCGLNERTWTEFIYPIIHSVADLMQQLPASESHHHAQPGGLFLHTCETMRHAVRLRQGMVMPAGRDAEDQARHKHRWTAGVIVAALLHDSGKPVTDLIVRLYGNNHRGTLWNALAGDMKTAQATHYAVDFPKASDRDYKAHQRHGALLMQRLVPSATLSWIGEDPPLLTTLMQYLSGESTGANPIATLVTAAEKESVRANLLDGLRTRFSTAKATPLIERLMDALRRMLAEGGHLPLNRPGAAGYVFEDDVWFAAARLANAVRDYLHANESSIGIPGEDKNDRLFDVWQDYGACRSNPVSGRALYSGRVEFDGNSDGYDLPSMLRFPLKLLYPNPDSYPAQLAGRIQSLEQIPKEQSPRPVDGTQLQVPAPIPVPSAATVAIGTSATPHPAPCPADADADADANKSSATQASIPVSASPVSPISESSVSVAVALKEPEPNPVQQQDPAPAILDPQDMASRTDLVRSSPTADTPTIRPVAPAMPLPTLSSKAGKVADPSAEAVSFMSWLQGGIADGSLLYNQPGALVHFVRHKNDCAMLLVSPLVFRRYAETKGTGAEGGLAVQRAFSGAGWHLRGAGGKNVVSYQVMRKGERGGNLLNGFLVLQPERFVTPVPPPNDRLVFWNADPTATKIKP